MKTQNFADSPKSVLEWVGCDSALEPLSRDLLARAWKNLRHATSLTALEVCLPLALALEIELQTAIRRAAPWVTIRESLRGFKKSRPKEIPYDTFRHLTFYSSCNSAKKFRPSISDCAALILLENRGIFNQSLGAVAQGELQTWHSALIQVQRVRNDCVHGLDLRSWHEGKLNTFLSDWERAFTLAIQWKWTSEPAA